MRIDYEKNPGGIVKRFIIPYGMKCSPPENNLYLVGIIRAITEEGFDKVNWFEGEVRYCPPNVPNREIGGMRHPESPSTRYYQDLKRGADNIKLVEKQLKSWCKSMGLEISDVVFMRKGVKLSMP